MARYRHSETGVVVVVDEKTAATLDPAFKPIAEKKPAARKSAAAKKE